MSSNFFNPWTAQNCPGNDTPNPLIDRMLGTAYAAVRYVAEHMADIQLVADFIRAETKPATPLPSSSLVYQADPTQNPATFDPSAAFIQQITLTQNVASSVLINTAAGFSIIIVRVVQDATGGRTFAWPPQFNSHGDINLDPSAISQQMFAKNPDNSYDQVGAMIYPNA